MISRKDLQLLPACLVVVMIVFATQINTSLAALRQLDKLLHDQQQQKQQHLTQMHRTLLQDGGIVDINGSGISSSFTSTGQTDISTDFQMFGIQDVGTTSSPAPPPYPPPPPPPNITNSSPTTDDMLNKLFSVSGGTPVSVPIQVSSDSASARQSIIPVSSTSDQGEGESEDDGSSSTGIQIITSSLRLTPSPPPPPSPPPVSAVIGETTFSLKPVSQEQEFQRSLATLLFGFDGSSEDDNSTNSIVTSAFSTGTQSKEESTNQPTCVDEDEAQQSCYYIPSTDPSGQESPDSNANALALKATLRELCNLGDLQAFSSSPLVSAFTIQSQDVPEANECCSVLQQYQSELLSSCSCNSAFVCQADFEDVLGPSGRGLWSVLEYCNLPVYEGMPQCT